MLTHYEDFLGKLTGNMQARCANNFQCDLFSVSLVFVGLNNLLGYLKLAYAQVHSLLFKIAVCLCFRHIKAGNKQKLCPVDDFHILNHKKINNCLDKNAVTQSILIRKQSVNWRKW